MVDAMTALFNMFGPWAIVIVVLIWGSKFLTDQMDKARADRLAERRAPGRGRTAYRGDI